MRLAEGSPQADLRPSGTLRISQHAFQHVCTRLVGWWRTKPRVDNSWRTEPGPAAAPEVKIGSYWRTMPQQSRIRCKGYSEPPDRIPAGSYQGTNSPRHIHWTRHGGARRAHVCHNKCTRLVDQCLENDSEWNKIGCFFRDAGTRG